MRYVAAYMLAVLGGNKSPGKKEIESILQSVGIDCEADKVDLVIKQLSGKNIEQLVAEGSLKLASVPSGGAVAASGGGGGGGEKAESKAAEPAAEEKKEESDEESDDDMGFGLFD